MKINFNFKQKFKPLYQISVSNGLRFNFSDFPKILIDWLANHFTIPNPEYVQGKRFLSNWALADIQQTLKLYWMDRKAGYISVPRGLAVEDLPLNLRKYLSNSVILNDRIFHDTTFPKFLLTLNREQKKLVDDFNVFSERARKGVFLYVAPTSAGKTIAAASIAAKSKQKTLILCPTNLIREAWYNDLEKAYGLERSEIGIIQQSKFTIGDSFTIGSVSTLRKHRDKWKETFSNFGTVIVDEAHLISAPKLWEFLSECPCAYIIGMTATHEREGVKAYLKALFGDPAYLIESTAEETESSFALDEVVEIRTEFEYEFQRDTGLNWNDLLIRISEDDLRNEIIVANVHEDWKRGRCPLVVTKRVHHAEILHHMLQERGVIDANLLIGATQQNKMAASTLISSVMSRAVRCVVATEQCVKLGANLNPLDCLHIAMPQTNKVDFTQLIGRVRRKWIGKKGNKVVYYIDSKMPYLRHKFNDVAVPVFQDLKVKKYEGLVLI